MNDDDDDPPTVRARATPPAPGSPGRAGHPLAGSTLPPPDGQRRPAQPEVILLDTVSRSAPTTHAPRRGEAAAGGVVVVATGSDGERVRKLCHKAGLLVPVMSSLGVVSETLSVVVIGEPSPPAPDRVVHVVRPAIDDDQLIELLRAIVGGRALVEPPQQPAEPDARASDAARRLASLTDRGAIEMVTIETITTLTEADRAQCLFYDPSTNALWSEAKKRGRGDPRQAMSGLVGWAAHTGQTLHASPAGDDARWLLELDDPDGKAQSRLLVQPIIGADRRVHAVLVAARRWRRTDFGARERELLAQFATLAGPALDLAAAAHAPARKASSTMTGIAAQKSAAVVAAPRPAGDSRPPPVTSPRPGGDSKPPPPPPRATAPQPAELRAPAIDAPRGDDAPTPKPPLSNVEPPKLEPPKPAPPLPKPTPLPPVVSKRERPPTGPVKQRAAESSAQMRKRDPDDAEPREVAVVAGEADVARVKKIAKKARLELSTFTKIAEAPLHYRIVAIGEAWSPESDSRIDYVARTSITDDQLTDLLSALANDRAIAPPSALTQPQSAGEARRTQIAFAGARKLATAPDLAAAEVATLETMRELLDTDRAYCLFYDPADGALWSEARRRASADERRAIAGMAGWAARTGRSLSVERASADPRWFAPLDDPDGDANSQLLIQPMVSADARTRGVLIAVRRPKRPGFTELDATLLARFAALAAPLLEQLALRQATQLLAGEDASVKTAAPVPAPPKWLELVRTLPNWAYAVLGAVFVLMIVMIARC